MTGCKGWTRAVASIGAWCPTPPSPAPNTVASCFDRRPWTLAFLVPARSAQAADRALSAEVQYPKDADMPEFPGAVLLNHVGLRTAQIGAAGGALVLSPLLWMRSGFKTPLFSQIIPKVAGRCFALGYFGGAAGVVAMAASGKTGRTGQPLTVEGVDDRAYRIVQNPKVQQIADFSSAGMAGALVTGSKGVLANMAFGSLAGLGCISMACPPVSCISRAAEGGP